MKWLFALFFVSLRIRPAELLRYETAGDWEFLANGLIRVTVADSGSWRYNFLVALHETIEAKWCRANGVSQQQVDQWDMVDFPKCRAALPPGALVQMKDVLEALDEPGNWRLAPYQGGHLLATKWERRAARLLLVSWPAYEARLDALFPETTHA